MHFRCVGVKRSFGDWIYFSGISLRLSHPDGDVIAFIHRQNNRSRSIALDWQHCASARCRTLPYSRSSVHKNALHLHCVFRHSRDARRRESHNLLALYHVSIFEAFAARRQPFSFSRREGRRLHRRRRVRTIPSPLFSIVHMFSHAALKTK